MIHNLSEIITNFLASKKVINENESDIYIYGYETFFSGVIDLIIQKMFVNITPMIKPMLLILKLLKQSLRIF